MKKVIKNKRLVLMLVILNLLLVGCGKGKVDGSKEDISSLDNKDTKTIEIGCMAITEPIIQWIAKDMEKDGYIVSPVVFDGNHLPATALKDGNIDGVILNHKEWMKTFNEENNANLIMPEPYMYYSRNAVYSSKYDKLEDIPTGATIAVPGDPTNMNDSLIILETLGFIKLGEKTNNFYTKVDIEDNLKNIEILETEITATARSIDDVDAIICRASHIKEAGRDPEVFLYEDDSVKDIPLGLIVDEASKDEEWVKDFLKYSQENEFKKIFTNHFKGTYVLFDN